MPSRRILLTASRDSLPHLAQLVRAWRHAGIAVRREPYAIEMPDIVARVARSDDLDAVLLVGSPRRAPATVLNSPFAVDRHGRHIPVAWLPATDPRSLRRFAAAAARVHQRARERTTVALLGQWHPRYLDLMDRIENLLPCRVRTFRWTGDVIGRDELVHALGAGLGLAIYVGHGRPIGWVGYRGLRARHFDSFRGEPLGSVVSLCCRTASRRRTGLSYAEALPLCGVTAASFGAVSETRHTDNTRWATRMCETLALGVDTLCELIARSAPPSASATRPYRLIGDPFAPVAAENSGARRAGAIPTYP
jgi:hypothetical protein